jgi:acyl dehydratase
MSTPLPLPAWLAQLRERCGTAAAAPRTAADAVNVPMIRRWCAAMGERNPLYLDEDYARTTPYGGIVAPPAMLEVWTMGGYQADGGREHGNLVGIEELDAAGFTAVVATNLKQEYLRYLRPGDRIRQQVFFEEVSEEKRTALGSGHFLNYRYEFTTADGTPVGRMRWILVPPGAATAATGAAVAAAAASAASHHARQRLLLEGLRQHRLLVRRCTRCQHLHHPPGPMCPAVPRV